VSDQAKRFLLPPITLAGLIGAWLAAVRCFDIPSYLLPDPNAVWTALWKGYVKGDLVSHLWYTSQAILLGYLIGCVGAFVMGVAFCESKTLERLFYPYVVAFQAMPKVALAPLIVVWFGFELASKVVMVAIICFFPLFINTIVGLKSAEPAMIDLMRAFSATRWQILCKIKIPAAAGHLFAGLEIGVVLALIGAVVAEFVSATKGLGYLVNSSAISQETNVMFAAMISLSALGYLGSALIKFIHLRVVFWDRRGHGEENLAQG
jgi:NitT/TauT family transport system permease protein